MRRARRALPWLILVVIKLWLVDGQRLTAYGTLTIDDQWFVERASFIADGEWLGPFAFDTLIKQPGYPMFIALTHRLGLPLLLAHQLLYVGALLVVMCAIRPLNWSRNRRLVLFALALFSPMTMNAPLSARPDRTAIFPSLTLLFFAGLIGIATAHDQRRPLRATAGWSLLCFLSLGSLWLTREEWLLAAPALMLGIGIAVFRWATARTTAHGHRAAGIAAVLCIPLIIPLGTRWLEHKNEAEYGLAVINVEQTSMSAAIGAMTRVVPATTFVQHPVTLETRQLIYPVSPTMAALQDEFENGIGQHFALPRRDGRLDVPGQAFMWAVLDSINAVGRAGSATELDATFHAIANEIDEACDDGRLRCSKPHHGIAPAWRWDRAVPLTGRTVTSLRRMFELTSFTAQPPPGNGTAQDRELFARMTHESLAPGPDTFFVRLRVTLIGGFRLLYRLLLAGALVLAIRRAITTGRTRSRSRPRPDWPLLSIVLIGAALVLFRAVGMAYLDLTTFPGFSPTYLAPGYAVGLLAAAIALLHPAARNAQHAHAESTESVNDLAGQQSTKAEPDGQKTSGGAS
jgi:hypothetical protein